MDANDRMEMLGDYDNVESRARQKGVTGVIHRILHLLPEDALSAMTRVVTRIYGGWYDERQLTTAAKALRDDINGNFPSTVPLSASRRPSNILLSVELALAPSITPEVDMMNT